MASLLVCESCGETVEYEATDFHATCPNCDHRHQLRAGCC